MGPQEPLSNSKVQNQAASNPASPPPIEREELVLSTSIVPSHRLSELTALRDLITQHLKGQLHPVVAEATGSEIFLIAERIVATSTSLDTSVLCEELQAALKASMPNIALHLRIIEIDRIECLDGLRETRLAYLHHPSLVSISYSTREFSFYTTGSTQADLIEAQTIAAALSRSLHDTFTLESARIIDRTMSGSTLSADTIGVATAIWGHTSNNTVANALFIDPLQRCALLVDERVTGGDQRANKAIRRYAEILPDYVLDVEVDKTMPDLTAFLTTLRLDPESCVTDFQLVADTASILVRILVAEREGLDCNSVCTKLSKRLRNNIPGALTVEGMPCTSEEARFCFTSVEPTWRLRSFDISNNGLAVRLHSHLRPPLQLPDTSRQTLLTRFSDGVFVREEGYVSVEKSDPSYSQILCMIPTRHELRNIQRCVVTGNLKLSVLSEPPTAIIDEIKRTTGAEVQFNLLKTIYPREIVREPIQWIAEYGERLPFELHPDGEGVHINGRGACKSVGASCFHINIRGYDLIIDFGAPLKEDEELEPSEQSIQNGKVLIVTHHHRDHAAALLTAVLRGWRRPILLTKATALATYSVLLEEAQRMVIPHGVIEDVFKLIRVVPYDVPIALTPKLRATFYQASHAIGSASVRMDYQDEDDSFSLTYTGDFKNGPNILFPAVTFPPPSDIVIAEGTYGMQPVAPLEEEIARLVTTIKTGLLEQGKIFILPLLTFNRSQEVLAILEPHRDWFSAHGFEIHTIGGIIDKNGIFEFVAADQPHEFSRAAHLIKPWKYSTHTHFSKCTEGNYHPAILDKHKPKVILVAGGMVVGHAQALVDHFQDCENAQILFTCYQAEGTLGRVIQEYCRGERQTIEGLPRYNLDTLRFQIAGHSAPEHTVGYIAQALKPGGSVVLVHGEESSLTALAGELHAKIAPGSIVIPDSKVDIRLR